MLLFSKCCSEILYFHCSVSGVHKFSIKTWVTFGQSFWLWLYWWWSLLSIPSMFNFQDSARWQSSWSVSRNWYLSQYLELIVFYIATLKLFNHVSFMHQLSLLLWEIPFLSDVLMWEIQKGVCDCATLWLFRWVFFPDKVSLVLSSHLYSSATGGLKIGPFLTGDSREDHTTPNFPQLLIIICLLLILIFAVSPACVSEP